MRWFKNRFITFIIFFLWESNTFTDNPEIFPLVTPKVQDNNWNSVQFKIKIDQKWQIKESVNRCKLYQHHQILPSASIDKSLLITLFSFWEFRVESRNFRNKWNIVKTGSRLHTQPHKNQVQGKKRRF